MAQFGTVQQALDRDDVEIIVNLTIPAAHAEVGMAALAAGKHVWNEKPLTVDPRAAGEDWSKTLSPAAFFLGARPDTFLGPGWQTTRRVIERGDIGEPRTASVVFQTAGPQSWHHNPEFLFQTGGGPAARHGALLPDRVDAVVRVDHQRRRTRDVGREGPNDRAGTAGR